MEVIRYGYEVLRVRLDHGPYHGRKAYNFEILPKLFATIEREPELSHSRSRVCIEQSQHQRADQFNRIENKNPQTHPGSTFADRRSGKGKSLYLDEDSKTKPPL